MFWLLTIAIIAFLVVPTTIALFETARLKSGPWDVGFWRLARSVAGTCHVPWNRRGSPIVRFELPDGRARIRLSRLPGWNRWRLEARCYQDKPFGFAARLTTPAQKPARWRTPGLQVVELFPEDEQYLPEHGLESTDQHLLRWMLRHKKLRETLSEVLKKSQAVSVETILVNRVAIVRVDSKRSWSVGDVVGLLGPPLVETVRSLSMTLGDLANALHDGEQTADAVMACHDCGQTITQDPHQCPGCGAYVHRGCWEMSEACTVLDCSESPDSIPAIAEVIRSLDAASEADEPPLAESA
ncbi:MAG: hypothetical protein VX589_02035 [Myxococcota bacterium]|nr:hypothetical protein [Myxococcota bacterium]